MSLKDSRAPSASDASPFCSMTCFRQISRRGQDPSQHHALIHVCKNCLFIVSFCYLFIFTVPRCNFLYHCCGPFEFVFPASGLIKPSNLIWFGCFSSSWQIGWDSCNRSNKRRRETHAPVALTSRQHTAIYRLIRGSIAMATQAPPNDATFLFAAGNVKILPPTLINHVAWWLQTARSCFPGLSGSLSFLFHPLFFYSLHRRGRECRVWCIQGLLSEEFFCFFLTDASPPASAPTAISRRFCWKHIWWAMRADQPLGLFPPQLEIL